MESRQETTIVGRVASEPRIGKTQDGKQVVNVAILVPHAHQEGKDWVQDEPERFDAHLWQPDRYYGKRAQEWAESTVRNLPTGQRVFAYGRLGESREIDLRDGGKGMVTDLTAYEIGPSLKLGGPDLQLVRNAERSADRLADHIVTATADSVGDIGI